MIFMKELMILGGHFTDFFNNFFFENHVCLKILRINEQVDIYTRVDNHQISVLHSKNRPILVKDLDEFS